MRVSVITKLVIWQYGFTVEGAGPIIKILEKNKMLKTLGTHGNMEITLTTNLKE